MMKKALKLAIGSILAAGIAAPASADVMHRTSVSGTLTYSEASSNGTTMGDFNTLIPLEPNFRAFVVEPDHEADFAVDATFRMHGTDTRWFVSYDHFNDKTERDAANLHNLQLVPAGSLTTTTAELKHRANEFRFGAKHTLHFGQRFDLVVNGFLEHQKVERTMREQHTRGTSVHWRVTENEMRGFGPGFGARGRVALFRDHPCWGIFGGMNASLLYADNEYSQWETSNAAGGVIIPPVTVELAFTPEDSKSIVSKLDAELGIDYTRVVNSDMARFMFSIALGVRYLNLVNAFKNGNTAWNYPTQTLPAAAGDYAYWTGPAHDFGRMGGFLQFRLGGAEA